MSLRKADARTSLKEAMMKLIESNIHVYDVVIIGGGLSALVLATGLFDSGVRKICLIEREGELGGNLRFALGRWPYADGADESAGSHKRICNYVESVVKGVLERKIKAYVNTAALRISKARNVLTSSADGVFSRFHAKAVVICTGARELSRGEVGIPGFRPSGVLTAGAMQRLVFEKRIDSGSKSVIIGSNRLAWTVAELLHGRGDDVACIMESASESLFDINADATGAAYDDFLSIAKDKLLLNASCTQILGTERVEGVNYEIKDDSGNVRSGRIDCDNIVISCGFSPETELAEKSRIRISDETKGVAVDKNFMTASKWVFAIGDAIGIHKELVDIIEESKAASKCIAKWLDDRRLVSVPRLIRARKLLSVKLNPLGKYRVKK